jgi:hypothetical protein
MLKSRRRAPVHQVISRGLRYARMKNTVAMWRNAHRTIKLADQLWRDRMSHPNETSVMMKRTLSNAASAVGL